MKHTYMLSMFLVLASLIAAPLQAEEAVEYEGFRNEKMESFKKAHAPRTSRMHAKRQPQQEKASSDTLVESIEIEMTNELSKQPTKETKEHHKKAKQHHSKDKKAAIPDTKMADAARQERAKAAAAKSAEEQEKRLARERELAKERALARERVKREAAEKVEREKKAAEERRLAHERMRYEHEERVKLEREKRAERQRIEADRKAHIKAEQEQERRMKKDQQMQKRAQVKARKEADQIARREEKERREAEAREASKRRAEAREARAHEKKVRDDLRQTRRMERVQEAHELGTYGYLYNVPAWPAHALNFVKPDLIQGSIAYETASRMYGSSGSKTDISGQVFDQGTIEFQDLFLASKLMRAGKMGSVVIINPGTAPGLGIATENPLYYLADAKVNFDGCIDRAVGKVDYVRRFWKNHVAVGVSLPIIYQQNKLKYSLTLSDAAKLRIRQPGDTIYNNFDQDPIAFFDSLLEQKGFVLAKRMSKTGMGDVRLFTNINITSDSCEQLLVGASVLFPTAQNRDISRLWSPELGNGGFPSFSGYFSVLLAHSRFFNPHFFGQITASVPSNVLVRAPRRLTLTDARDNQQAGEINAGLVGRQYVNYATGGPGTAGTWPFDDYDSTARGLADKARKVKIARGPEFEVQIGNLMSNFIMRRLSLDLYYHLYLKGRDSVHSGSVGGEWDLSKVAANSHRMDHSIGGQFAYQFDDCFRLKIEPRYVFAGRNAPALFSIALMLSAEF